MAMTDVRAQYTEQAVGANHPTLADTINRLVKGINNFRLKLSAGNLTLEAVNGNLVDINEVIYSCTAMPTLSAVGLTPFQLYYIYLYNNAGTETLEASVTGYTVDSKGRANKTGDLTRRLMGMAMPFTGPAWVDSLQYRYVINYDNDRAIALRTQFTANRALVNTAAFVEINTEIRAYFLAFARRGASVRATGGASSATGGGTIVTGISLDYATSTPPGANYISEVTAGYVIPISCDREFHPGDLADGAHSFTLIGGDAGGTVTVTWYGGAIAPSMWIEAQIWG